MIEAKEQERRNEIYALYVQNILPKFSEQIEADKEEFKRLCREYITSDRKKSVENILNGLEKTDFFTAPSSTAFHLNIPGGLCKHSINVFNTALALCEKILNEDIESGRTIAGISKVTAESIAVTALFHDLCKINMYFPDEKFTKEGIKWVRHLKWGIEDKLPIGHAEKSLYFASKLISLMPDEVMAIRWHMGMYDIGEKGSFLRNSFYTASDECPLVTILHCADTYVSKCMETTYDLTQYTL